MLPTPALPHNLLSNCCEGRAEGNKGELSLNYSIMSPKH